MYDIFNERRLVDDLMRRQSAKTEQEVKTKERKNRIREVMFQKPKVENCKMFIDFSNLSDTLDIICKDYKKEILDKKEAKTETESKKTSECRCNDCPHLNQCVKKHVSDRVNTVFEVKEAAQKYFESAEFNRKLKALMKEIISEMLNK